MADSKSNYSDSSFAYVDNNSGRNSLDSKRIARSLKRKEENGKNWEKYKVNINEIVSKFIPENETMRQYTQSGIKYVFEGDRYIITCDKVGGYLKIYDKALKRTVDIDGNPINDKNGVSHYKIKKKAEM